jgi:hypothetical protein
MEVMKLSFGVMLGFLQQVIKEQEDPRKESNAKRYELKDILLGAFSVFYMQCESFLEHQRQMQSRKGKDNAQSIFGLLFSCKIAVMRSPYPAIISRDLSVEPLSTTITSM